MGYLTEIATSLSTTSRNDTSDDIILSDEVEEDNLANLDERFIEVYKRVEEEFVAKAELEKHISFVGNIINIISEVIFKAKVIYEGSVEFIADATFRGSIKVNADTAGQITIPANTKKL